MKVFLMKAQESSKYFVTTAVRGFVGEKIIPG